MLVLDIKWVMERCLPFASRLSVVKLGGILILFRRSPTVLAGGDMMKWLKD